MEQNIITYLACIFFIFILGKIFIVPIKTILKLVLNSLLGGLCIYIINLIGANYGFHIGINIVTSMFIGLLGVPGAILLIVLILLIRLKLAFFIKILYNKAIEKEGDYICAE